MHLSTLHTAHPADQSHQPVILHTHLPDQCTTVYPSVVTSDPMDTSNSSSDTTPESSDIKDEDFLTVPMDDEHWTTELAPERTFCIHENGLPNNACSYPCPYRSNNTVSYIDSLDLSDVSDLEDHFLTTSDEEELPGLEEVPY